MGLQGWYPVHKTRTSMKKDRVWELTSKHVQETLLDFEQMIHTSVLDIKPDQGYSPRGGSSPSFSRNIIIATYGEGMYLGFLKTAVDT